MGGKLRETNDEARTFAIGNKSLASLFVHTPAGKIFVHCPGSYHVLKLAPDLYLCNTAKNSLYQHLLYGDAMLFMSWHNRGHMHSNWVLVLSWQGSCRGRYGDGWQRISTSYH
jgi:hypothetical protein